MLLPHVFPSGGCEEAPCVNMASTGPVILASIHGEMIIYLKVGDGGAEKC